MSIFDKLENAQAQAAQNQEQQQAVGILLFFLEIKKRFARIVGVNGLYFGLPMALGIPNIVGTIFCLTSLIVLNNISPTPATAQDPEARGLQNRIGGWTRKWWVGALIAWFFGIKAWADLFQDGPQWANHAVMMQGATLIALSAFAWAMLKFGPRTGGMISVVKGLGGQYVRSVW
jgi:hypothetical protein